MSSYKDLTANDIKTSRSFLNQLVDVIQEDISGSNSSGSFTVTISKEKIEEQRGAKSNYFGTDLLKLNNYESIFYDV